MRTRWRLPFVLALVTLAAPLIAGNDLRNMSKATKEILTNREAIAVNQDSLGIQGFRYSAKNSLEIWFKPLSKNEWAVCFLNRGPETKDVTFAWKEHSVVDGFSKRGINFNQTTFTIRDLWTQKEIGKTNKAFAGQVASHGVKLLKLTPGK